MKIEKKAKANVSVMWTNIKKMPNTNSKNNKLSTIEGLKIRDKKGSPRESCDVSLIYKSIENYLYNIEKNATKTRKNKKI